MLALFFGVIIEPSTTQLRQAGYKVGKAKKQGKVTAEQADEMLRELEIE